jgi:diaminopimelate decarboxylase
MGGGIGIPYHPNEKPMDLEKVAQDCFAVLEKRSKEFDLGKPALAMEPGRFFVGDAGWLITRVNGIKESYKKFVGIDAGFHTMIRPALYDAEHTFVVEGKEQEENTETVDICGQICENTDIMAYDYQLPKVQEGDLIVVENCGAYGYVMSMPYNMRLRPAEVAVYNGRVYEITRRENMDDYYRRIKQIE